MKRTLPSLTRVAVAGLSLAAVLAACSKVPDAADAAPVPTGRVEAGRLAAIDQEPGQWLTSGRDAGKTFYSPLDQINAETVSRLGFAWQFETGTNRGMQATPIVVDGVMYTSGVAGRVYALDAASGKVITGPEVITRGWVYAPEAEDLIDGCVEAVRDAVKSAFAKDAGDIESLQRHVRRAAGRYVNAQTKRRPMIVPVVMEA